MTSRTIRAWFKTMTKSDEDVPVCWADVDTEAVKRMIAESDAEGGEIPLEEIVRRLADKSASHR
jgi:hypothetical protein